jgi:hypothetical protein
MIDKSYAFIINNISAEGVSKMNSFFSGSIKTVETLPYWYPGNVLEYLNGTKMDPLKTEDAEINSETVFAM